VVLVKSSAYVPAAGNRAERKRALIWCTEHLARLADEHSSDGKCVFIFDLRGFGMQNVDTEGATWVVDTLQRHYPERLSQLFVYDAPTPFWVLWSVISPFLIASTRDKVALVAGDSGIQTLHKAVPASLLPNDLKGTAQLRPFADVIQQLTNTSNAGSISSEATQ
jgi:hypothetical protein